MCCMYVRTVISIGTSGPNTGSYQRAFIHCLAKTNADISYPSNETWWYDSQGVHVPVLKHPTAVAYAASTSEVQALVKCAVRHDVRICPRSGGHSYEAFSNEDDHLVIDVSRIAYVKVNPVSTNGLHTASVGAGIRFGPLYYELGQYQMTFPGTLNSSMGLGGVVPAGGNGYLTRMWGLSADNVLELEMVDYRGRAVVANEKTNPDLFFALRGGGGGSYGVVVRMELNIHPYPKLTTGFIIRWNQPIPASEFVAAWFEWKPWETLPPELYVHILYGSNTIFHGMYLGEDGEKGLKRYLDASGFLELGPKGSLDYQHYSSADHLETRAWLENRYSNAKYLSNVDYRAFNSPTSFIFKPLDLPPYPKSVHPSWESIQNDPRVNATHSYGAVGTVGPIPDMEPSLISHDYAIRISQAFDKEFDAAAYRAIDDFLSQEGAIIVFILYGGRVSEFAEDFNGFPHRRIHFILEYWSSYFPIGDSPYSGLQGQKQLMYNIVNALEPYSVHMSYQGHVSLLWTTDPKIYMPRYFGNNTARLIQAKRMYDPKDYFKNMQSTPTA